MTPAPGSCLPLLFLCLPISAVRCCDAGSGVVCLPLVSLSPSYQMLWRWLRGCVSRLSPCVSAVGCQLAAWSCLPLPCACVSQSLRSDARRWLQGGVSRLSPSVSQSLQSDVCPASRLLPVSQSVQSDARCCDAGCGVVSCLPLVSLCPARSLRSDPLSPSFSQTLVPGLRSDARCWDAGSGVVSPACLPVSPSLCGWLFV